MTNNSTSNNFSNYVNQNNHENHENRNVIPHFNPNNNYNYSYNPRNQMTLDKFIKLDKMTQLNSNNLSEVIYKKLDNYFSYPPHVFKLRILYQRCDIRGDSSYDKFIILKYIAFSLFILSCYHNYVILQSLRRNQFKITSISLNFFILSTSLTILFVAKSHANDSFDKRFDGRKIREIEFFVNDTPKRKLL